MKVAIIGSRNLTIDISNLIPLNTTEIISGGAVGIDRCARQYANENNVKLTEFLPDYKMYSRGAPLQRNKQIIDAADYIIAIWDGKSHGTKHGIDYANKIGKPIKIHIVTVKKEG